MKHAFLSRRHRNPHQHDEQQKEQPFFSKANDTESEPFFSGAGHAEPVQAKLVMGQPGDKYEKEADTVADHVVNGQTQTAVQPKGISAIQRLDLATPIEDEKLSTAEARMEKDKVIQEKADARVQPAAAETVPEKKEKPVQMAPASTGTAPEKKEKPVQMAPASTGPTPEKKEKPVQMAPASTGPMPEKKEKPVQMAPASTGPTPEKKEKIQAKANPLVPGVQREPEAGVTTTSAQLSSRIQDSSGKGKPLPGKTRAEMESALGTDFSGVNIHTDTSAVQMNEELSAQAFTHGQDVYFNSGKYHPESAEGQRLLAHELTHVVQQTGNDRVSLDRANTANKSVGVKNTLKSSFIFSGSTKFQDALITIGDLSAAVKHGDCSLSELVIILNNNKFPQTGAVIQGDRYNFQIVSADPKKLSIPKIKLIKKQ